VGRCSLTRGSLEVEEVASTWIRNDSAIQQPESFLFSSGSTIATIIQVILISSRSGPVDQHFGDSIPHEVKRLKAFKAGGYVSFDSSSFTF
jgi:hypothetical protein